jgi:hypothetical protein
MRVAGFSPMGACIPRLEEMRAAARCVIRPRLDSLEIAAERRVEGYCDIATPVS